MILAAAGNVAHAALAVIVESFQIWQHTEICLAKPMRPMLDILRAITLSCLIGVVFTSVGCTTHADRLRGIRDSFYEGDLQQASESIEKAAKKKSDENLLDLDQAQIEMFAGRPQASEQLLRKVRDQFDYLQKTTAAEQAAAMVADDNRLAYAGEDYERILIRVMLAISNLLLDGQDAFAYAHQILDEEQKLNEKRKSLLSAAEKTDSPANQEIANQPAGTSSDVQAEPGTAGKTPAATSQLAISHYLMGVLREQTHRDYHEALRHYEQARQCKPDFSQVLHDIERARSGHHSQRGHGVLYVITFVGQGPYKEETAHLPSSAALLIADRILSAVGKHSLPPTIAPVKVPTLVRHAKEIDHVQVAVDAGPCVPTETIVDVGDLAEQTHEQEFPQVVARAVVRRIVKKAAVYQTKEIASVHSPVWEIAFDLAGVAWEAAESADTRCWGLLPDRIQIARLELPAGQHRVRMQAAMVPNIASLPGTSLVEEAEVLIHDGRNTYLLANFPSEKLVGQIITSK